ncbi:MAG: glycosyltransferase family 4 protein, partial [Acidimicrobiales bacterium]
LFSLTDVAADSQALSALRKEKATGGADWLFVGRISPHKAQHDLIKALACARSMTDPSARLHLVGTSLGIDYLRALERFADRLGIADAVRMPGTVTAGVLAGYYETADVFVCVSDHEGFCVPIIEAMGRGCPVVAHEAAAVGETVGEAGIVLHDKSPVTVATAVDRVTSDPMLNERLVSLGKKRAELLSVPSSGTQMVTAIKEAISISSGGGS